MSVFIKKGNLGFMQARVAIKLGYLKSYIKLLGEFIQHWPHCIFQESETVYTRWFQLIETNLIVHCHIKGITLLTGFTSSFWLQTSTGLLGRDCVTSMGLARLWLRK